MPSERRTARAIAPAQAAVRLRKTLAIVAKHLAREDRHLREDLEQEMALAILEHGKPNTVTRFLTIASWRARDYCRRNRPAEEKLLPVHRVRKIAEGQQRGDQ
ncbi:MAG: hypothetical protein L6R28_01555 [Planctomycetes bacterium]|nr:hypothetical protein [Planctomycetota bacterium]